MNTYSFHFSLYDLSFLGAIFIGLTFALQLWFAKSINRGAKRFLSLALLVMVWCMMQLVAGDICIDRQNGLSPQFSLAFGPLIYFYVLKLTRPEYKFSWKNLLHFSPLLLELGAWVLEPQLNFAVLLLMFISVLVYLYLSHKLIEDFYQHLKFVGGDRYRTELQWLHRLLTGFGLLWLFWTPYIAVDYFGYHNRLDAHAFYPLHLVLAVTIIWIGVVAFFRSEIELPAEVSPSLKPSASTELRQKGAWLKKAMEAGSFYRDAELSLSSLAEKLSIHPHELSRIINIALKKNFNDFVNEYRVRDVAVKMQDPAYDHLNLLGIAYESGFNSKTTFHRIFKEMTGKSPADYKAERKKDIPHYNLEPRGRIAPLILHRETLPKWGSEKSNRNFMFRNYVKIAWRSFLKDRQFTMLNLVGLATGLACVLLIYMWVNDELHVGKFNAKDSQLYQVMENGPSPDGIQTGENTPGLLARSLKEEMPEVEYAVSTIHPGGLTNGKGIFSVGDKHIGGTSLFAGKDIFNVFSYKVIKGDKSHALINTNNVLLSDEMALKLFHSTENIIGKSVDLNLEGFNGLYIVSGVFQKPPANALDQFDAIFSYDLFLQKNPKLLEWGNNDPDTYVILRKGTNINHFNSKIAHFIAGKNKESKSTLFIQKYSDRYLYNNYKNGFINGGRIEYVRLFSIIAIFILVMACINFMNLSTAKASSRLKEAGIKKVVGAGRLSLVAQYLGESLFMAFLSLGIAAIIAIALLPYFNQLTGKNITLHFDAPLILSALAIAVFTGFVSGSYPALYISGFKPINVLKGTAANAGGGTWVRKSLVVFQFTLSAIFIVSVLVIYKQMQLIQTKNLGYNRDNILYFEKGGMVSDNSNYYKPGGAYDKELETLLTEVKNIPGVINAANFRHNIVNRHGGTTDLSWPGEIPGTSINFTDIAAGYGFIETLGIQMEEGRPFSARDTNGKPKIIFNEAAIESMGLKNPIGKMVHVWGEDREIIGVTKNFHFESLYESLKPCFFDFTFGHRASKIMVKIKAGTEKETIARLVALYNRYNPGIPFEYRFLDEDYQALYASEQRVAVLSRYFAGIAIIISCLGLFGLAAFTTQRRQKEIGIRKVIGATVSNVIVMLSADFLKLVLVAVLVAFPIAWWVTGMWLRSFAYRVHMSAGIFLAAGSSIILITLITISYQAVKAGLINPVKSLRSE